ncbi:MAG: carbohydrate ABC transporter permease [Bacilli bacterium]
MKDAKRHENLAGTLMACMPFIGYLIFGLLPMFISLYISFCDLKSFNIYKAEWIGFDNYISLFSKKWVYIAIRNTLYFSLGVPITVLMSLFLANLLSKPLKGKEVARVILYLPSVTSAVAVTLMWQWIFSEFGLVNTIITRLGGEAILFMTTDTWFMPLCIFIAVWMRGTNIMQLQSALSNVNKTLVEAATIDGASKRKIFLKVTLPAISPTLFYVIVMSYIAAFQEMAIMSLIANSDVGPNFAAMTLTNYIYRMAFTQTNIEGFGIASALSWVTCIFILLFSRILFKVGDKLVTYDN